MLLYVFANIHLCLWHSLRGRVGAGVFICFANIKRQKYKDTTERTENCSVTTS